MSLNNLAMRQFRRVSPSRYTAMQACLLREVWDASGNEPLLPQSPLPELGSIIHQLLESAGRGQLNSLGNDEVEATWDALVSKAEEKLTQSALRKHLVPLSRSIPDFEVRKLRAFRRAAEIARDVFQPDDGRLNQCLDATGFELWVESDDGQIGGYIDRVRMTTDGVVLCDYKSGAVLDSGTGEGPKLKRAYEVQLILYAALYRLKCGAWPIRLEVVPLQGTPVQVVFNPTEAECLLAEAGKFLLSANKLIAEVERENAEITSLASPQAVHCRLCLFRPSCHAYWIAREQDPLENWPADVQGFLRETSPLRNGKVSMRIAESDSSTSPCVTVRNLTNCSDRHPLLNAAPIGSKVTICGLKYNYRSGDYTETQNTVICGTD